MQTAVGFCLQVLVWSGGSVDDFVIADGIVGSTFFALLDTKTDQLKPGPGGSDPLRLQALEHDMFCPGISMLANGDFFVVGGSVGGDGSGSSTTWSGNSFSIGPKLNIERGYNSAVTLANGNV